MAYTLSPYSHASVEGKASLLDALAHSLLLRDRLVSDIAQLRSSPCSPCPLVPNFTIDPAGGQTQGSVTHKDHHGEKGRDRTEQWIRRGREREKAIDERERKMLRLEKWIVEEMRWVDDSLSSRVFGADNHVQEAE